MDGRLRRRGGPDDARPDDAGAGARLARWAAPALCALAVAASLMGAAWLLNGGGRGGADAGDGSPGLGQVAEGRDGAGAGVAPGAEGLSDADAGASDDAPREDSSAGGTTVSAETFLSVLDGAPVDGSGVASVSWDDEGGLVALASDVLAAYRDCPGARLQTSGYLDLKGNAWSAIVSDGGSWVDIVVVSSLDDGGATARVARLGEDAAARTAGR